LGFRFRKRISLLPGIRLNFSKSGVSTSIGGRGATINLGSKGTRSTVGIPGTGLSYSERLTSGGKTDGVTSTQSGQSGNAGGYLRIIFIAGLVLLVLSQMSHKADPNISQAPAPTEAKAPATAIVKVSALNCRVLPAKNAAIKIKLVSGSSVTVIARQAEWSQVSNGTTPCWVFNSYLSWTLRDGSPSVQ
jgi:hypothetical protein